MTYAQHDAAMARAWDALTSESLDSLLARGEKLRIEIKCINDELLRRFPGTAQ